MSDAEKFEDPIYWAVDMPIPININPDKLIRVPRKQFEAAEMAAIDELPRTLRKAIAELGFSGCAQLLLKGLKHGEFSEANCYLALLAHSPASQELERRKARLGIINREN